MFSSSFIMFNIFFLFLFSPSTNLVPTNVKGGDKLTLALNTSLGGASCLNNNNNLSPTSNLAKLVNVESASKIPKAKPPTPPPRTTSDPCYANDISQLIGMDSGIGMTTDIPISVTHFSSTTNGYGIERETIFTDGSEERTTFKDDLDPASIVRKHLTNPFLTPDPVVAAATESEINPFTGKFNTIGRSNPFSTPNRSRNPFLDNTTVPQPESSGDADPVLTNGNYESGEKTQASPDASIDPTPILTPTQAEEFARPAFNKIVSTLNQRNLLRGFYLNMRSNHLKNRHVQFSTGRRCVFLFLQAARLT